MAKDSTFSHFTALKTKHFSGATRKTVSLLSTIVSYKPSHSEGSLVGPPREKQPTSGVCPSPASSRQPNLQPLCREGITRTAHSPILSPSVRCTDAQLPGSIGPTMCVGGQLIYSQNSLGTTSRVYSAVHVNNISLNTPARCLQASGLNPNKSTHSFGQEHRRRWNPSLQRDPNLILRPPYSALHYYTIILNCCSVQSVSMKIALMYMYVPMQLYIESL